MDSSKDWSSTSERFLRSEDVSSSSLLSIVYECWFLLSCSVVQSADPRSIDHIDDAEEEEEDDDEEEDDEEADGGDFKYSAYDAYPV